MKSTKLLTYGDGKIHTQQGMLEGHRCLTLTEIAEPQPINSSPKTWPEQTNTTDHDVVLVFKNIEGARTLQDELSEMIAIWSRENGSATKGGGE